MVATIKSRSELERLIGSSLRLKPWESIEKINLSPDSAAVLIRTYQVTELVREVRYNKSGLKLITWSLDDGQWLRNEVTIWDEPDDFTPVVAVLSGTRRTPEELQSRREYDKLCYRPGSAQSPLDNYTRVWEGYTTDKMERYW